MKFETLDKLFSFVYDNEGCLIYHDNMTDEVIQADNDNKAWTVLDCEGTLYLVHGLQYVDRFAHIISEMPCLIPINPVRFED